MKAKILFLVLYMIPTFTLASHKVAGVELTYERKSSGKYDVYIHVVRHCDGAALGPSTLIARCSSSTVQLTQQTLVSVRKLNPCQTEPCSGVGNYEERVWKAELDLSAYSCCEWTLSYYNDFRYNGQQYYIQSSLNKCAEVSGGYFIQKPQITLRYNEDLALNFGFQSYDAADSISYELVTALADMNQSMTYSGNYSPIRPISFFGFPNQNLQWPAGFRLAYDGVLRFRPTLMNNQGAIAVEAKIWKEINGMRQVVGRVVRDIEVVTVSAHVDAAPSIDFLQAKPDTVNIYFCAGDTTPLIWQSKDADDDSTFVELVYTDPDIQISTDYSQGKQIRINARISSTLADTASTQVRYLRFYLMDKSCPFPRSNLYTLALRPAKKPVAFFSDSLNCRQLLTNIQVSDSVNSSFRSWYSYYDDKYQLISSSINGHFNSPALPLGTSYLNLSYGFQGGCSMDTTIALDILPDFKFALSSPDAFCEGDSLKLELLRQGSTGTYTYQWANLTSTTTPYLIDSQEVARVFPPVNSIYEVTATDSAGCFVSYTKLVRMVEFPQYTMDSVVMVCPGDSAWIGPSSFLFSDLNLWMDGDTNFPRRDIKTGWHSFYAIHENLCEIHDSVYLGNHTSPQLEKVPADTNLCPGTKYYINTSLGSRPFTYEWNGMQTAIPRTVSQSEWVNLVVKDKHGCRDSAAFQMWVNEKPNLIFSSGPNLEFCQGDSMEVKVLNVPPKASLIWSDSSSPDIKIFYPGMYVLTLTDSGSCTFLYTLNALVWPKPDAGFSYAAQTGGVAFTPNVLNQYHTWFFGDGNSSTNGLPIHKYATPGTYLVNHFVSDLEHGCQATDSMSILVLTLPELEEWGISVYPNPFKETINIHYAGGRTPISVQLFDLQGRMISIHTEIAGNYQRISGLDNLAPGTYILRILTPEGPVDTRIQKEY